MTQSDDKKYKGKAAFEEIASRLGVFGTGLQDAFSQIADAVEKAEQQGEQTGDTTDFTVNTDRGPIQARAGWSVKVGGLGGGASDDFTVKPVNEGREQSTTQKANPVREPHVETYEEDGQWVLVVELPGTRAMDLRLTPEADSLIIETVGARQFKTTVTPPETADLDQIEQRFVNGVLEVRAPLTATKEG